MPEETVGAIVGLPTHKTYAYHKPSADGLAKIQHLRSVFSMVHDIVLNTAPNSRERSIALTNLEEAAMWAIKSVVCNDPESEITT